MIAGILLPDSVLVSPWFLLLATVVAFNTIIYVGLTMAKLIPWPQQFHPDWVRQKLERVGVEIDEEAAVREIPVPEVPESDDPYDRLRLAIARRDIPQAFALTGGLLIVFSIISAVVFRDRDVWVYVVELTAGVVMLVTAVVLGHREFRGRTMMRAWAVAAVVIVFLLLFETYATDNIYPSIYALVAMTAYFPVTLAWRPAIIAGGFMLAGLATSLVMAGGTENLRVFWVGASCLLIGAVLLRLRLRALDALADERERADSLASTDPLTGALTRRGVMTLIPGMASNAGRSGQGVCVCLVDVVDMGQANDNYGIAYGDDVLRTLAEVLRQTMRGGDLVSRWGGDEFLVVGPGQRPDPVAMRERLEGALRLTGVSLGRPPIRLDVRTAAGDPGETTFEQLLHETSAEPVVGG